MSRQTVLLLFGGESSEHEVSVSSARNVYAAIDNAKFDVLIGYIDREGKWWQLDVFDDEIETHAAPQLVPVLGSGGFVTIPSSRIITPDVILPILHGKNGEDGSVQGLGQLLHIPVVGCDMTASAICMDKVATKEILETRHFPVVPYESHRRNTPVPDFSHLSMKLGSPMFVKPARAGSSVGVSKVYSDEELAAALELAHKHDDVALIEQGVTARELEVAVLGNPPHHKASVVGEINPGDEFYSYDAKYSSGSHSSVEIPAQIDDQLMQKIRQMAVDAYVALGCRGLSRVDFFLDENDQLFINEINTLPGFTNISMYPKLWRHEGLMYSTLIEALISAALEQTIEPELTEE